MGKKDGFDLSVIAAPLLLTAALEFFSQGEYLSAIIFGLAGGFVAVRNL